MEYTGNWFVYEHPELAGWTEVTRIDFRAVEQITTNKARTPTFPFQVTVYFKSGRKEELSGDVASEFISDWRDWYSKNEDS